MGLEEDYGPEQLVVLKNYYLRYYDADASTPEEAIYSVHRCFEDLRAFLVAVGTTLHYPRHYEALVEVLKSPLHANTYRLIAKRNPWVLVAIAVGVAANMMSIETGTQLFEGVYFFQFNGDEEEVIIASPLTGLSPERLQELSDRFKPLTGEDLPKGDVNTVATFVFNKVGIPIKAQPGKPVRFNLRKFSDTLGVICVLKSDYYFNTPPSSFYDMSSSLDPDKWSTNFAARMTNGLFQLFGSARIDPLKCDPVPPRDVAYPEVFRELRDSFDRLIERVSQNRSKDMLSKDEEEGGNHGAHKQPGNDLLAGLSDGQIRAPNPTAGPTISSPPNAARPGAEAGNAALKETINSEFKGVLDTGNAAFGAELESFRISKRQRSAGPLTMLCILVAALAVIIAASAVLVCLHYTWASQPVFEVPGIEN